MRSRRAVPAVAVGALNGDGALDLAVINTSANTIAILFGDGTCDFDAAHAISIAVDIARR